MTQSRGFLIYGAGFIIWAFVAAYIASVVYYFLSGYGAGNAQPWSIFSALPYFTNEAVQSKLIASVGAPLVLSLFVLAAIFKPSNKHQFGDARWATTSDIAKAGLFERDGIILGQHNGRYLMSNTPTHVMTIAPTRSGKGVGLVVPNLLNWKGSLICLDIKKENYKKTSGFRQKFGHEVFMWSPMSNDGRSHRYNPLDAISKDPYQKVSDLQVLANILIPNPDKGETVWAAEARALFVGLALYVMDKSNEMPSTIGAISRLFGAEQDLGDICRHVVKTYKELSTPTIKSLMNFANKAAKERSGVKTSINQIINLWDNPAIDAATSHSDFSLSDLRKKKMAIYVGVSTGQIASIAPLIRVFFEQVITTLSTNEPDPETEPHHVLLMMDELHMLGNMESMTKAFTLLGGYNCRVMAVVQGLKWLDDTYTRDKRDGILSCCAHQVFFAANDLETARYVSESCGDKTISTTSHTKRNSFKLDAPSNSTSYRGIPLITKDKVKQLPKNQGIILCEGSRPVKAKKVVYFKAKHFKNRLYAAPEVPPLTIAEEKIPEFNIQEANANEPDPNQTELPIGLENNNDASLMKKIG